MRRKPGLWGGKGNFWQNASANVREVCAISGYSFCQLAEVSSRSKFAWSVRLPGNIHFDLTKPAKVTPVADRHT
jgi:hypothetical protein